ncbi:MAG: urea carboxylase-associated family protein [Desulfobacterales bacterium]|nr:urea carboxylase-associated family protein [Desulfobacterales bacterium]
MQSSKQFTIEAGKGLALSVKKGQFVRVINTYGTQVVDTWAFSEEDTESLLSMEHCREVLQRIIFEPGDQLITNRYQPILKFTEDTSPGGHDTLIAACSQEMYIHAGRKEYHANCRDNLINAVKPFGIKIGITPSPWNLFMLAPIRESGLIDYVRPTSKPGDYVEVCAEMDCIMAFSACPDEIYPTNGGDGTPVDAHVILLNKNSVK